ncbi:hypothetical protein GA0070622_3006 [Micromonospora sediminicola]|uniref:Uncharacterized protein n=1 Tax=Micromonospora sediminicola TaxID=946078 RepID=A0A1A9BAI5_9ACTN|nr:ribonuclease [Micromonospora sediminicola]SBT65989.1 hypothetical protein GA0070622_3006 [Micromonospora sediminicola]
MTEPEQFGRQQEDPLETGRVFQDAEGRRTTDPAEGEANATRDADRNAAHLAHGEVGPGVPEE